VTSAGVGVRVGSIGTLVDSDGDWSRPESTGASSATTAVLEGGTSATYSSSFSVASLLTMLALMPLLEEAGEPPGVVQVLPSRNTGALVDHMLHDPRVRVVSFTGSTQVGRKLLHAAADQVLKPAMELGGNAPLIVFEDADLDVAVAGAMLAKMRNLGEALQQKQYQRAVDLFAGFIVDRDHNRPGRGRAFLAATLNRGGANNVGDLLYLRTPTPDARRRCGVPAQRFAVFQNPGQTARQVVTLRQGVDTELGKKIQRLIKDSKLKVQSAIQDQQVRVTGKSRDDLQDVIALVRKAELDLPLQFTNFRD